jgi:hypothetical protein
MALPPTFMDFMGRSMVLTGAILVSHVDGCDELPLGAERCHEQISHSNSLEQMLLQFAKPSRNFVDVGHSNNVTMHAPGFDWSSSLIVHLQTPINKY